MPIIVAYFTPPEQVDLVVVGTTLAGLSVLDAPGASAGGAGVVRGGAMFGVSS